MHRARNNRARWVTKFIFLVLITSGALALWAIMNMLFGCTDISMGGREESMQRSVDHYKTQYENLRKRITEVRFYHTVPALSLLFLC